MLFLLKSQTPLYPPSSNLSPPPLDSDSAILVPTLKCNPTRHLAAGYHFSWFLSNHTYGLGAIPGHSNDAYKADAESPSTLFTLPEPVSITSVQSYSDSTIFIDSLMRAWVWGFKDKYHLHPKSPTLIREVSGVVETASSIDSVLLLNEEGNVFVYGGNKLSLLGMGLPPTQVVKSPKLVDLPFKVKAIAAGDYHHLFLTYQGDVYVSGSNLFGQCLDCKVGDQRDPDEFGRVVHCVDPVRRILSNVKLIASGYAHCMAVTQTGSLLGWGSNDCGQLGFECNRAVCEVTPVDFDFSTTIKSIKCGYDHSVILLKDGRVFVCGSYISGQLGILIITRSLELIEIDLPEPIKEIEAGPYHTLALSESGVLYGFGYNAQNQLGLSVVDHGNTVFKPTVVTFN
ncbi:hypothetical protein GEMRC1_006787 [Eukaryota sp. GEM-RC1]